MCYIATTAPSFDMHGAVTGDPKTVLIGFVIYGSNREGL